MNLVGLQKIYYHFFLLLLSTLLIADKVEAVWSLPVTISQAGVDSRFSSIVSAADTAVAVWLTFDDFDNSDVLASSTFSGGVWSMPTIISSSTRRVIDPILVVDSNNDCVLIWTSYGPSNAEILAARLPFGGIWTAPVTVFTAAATERIEPTSLIATTDTIGQTIVVWTIFDGTNFLIDSSTFTP